MDTPDRILELLYDRRDGWWSLKGLADAAGVTRGRVEAVLDELRVKGHPLQLAPTSGVRLDGWPMLNGRLIERNLQTHRIGRNVICFGELNSTNDTAADSARQPDSDGLVVLAESQRKGRGRRGRMWLCGPGDGVLMSVVLSNAAAALPIEAVTVAAGMATAEAIELVISPSSSDLCRLKWPNDVLIDGSKVAGILVEQRSSDGGVVIVGVGVNVNGHPADEDVDRPATSLAAHAAAPVDRIEVARALCRRLDDWVVNLAADRDAAVERLGRQWARRCGMINCRHTIVSGTDRYSGRVVEIDPLTGLVILTDEGLHVHIPAAGATVV